MKTLRDRATVVYNGLKARYQNTGDPLDLEAMNVIEQAMNRIPKRAKRPIDKSKAEAASKMEIQEFLRVEMQYTPEDADKTASYLWLHWTENNWRNGARPMRDWRRTVKKWHTCGYIPVGYKGFAKKTATTGSDHDGGF